MRKFLIAMALMLAVSTQAQAITFDDIDQGVTNVAFTASMRNKLDGIENGATFNEPNGYLMNRANHIGMQPMSSITGLEANFTTMGQQMGLKSDNGHTHIPDDILFNGGDYNLVELLVIYDDHFENIDESIAEIPETFDDLTDGSTNKAFTATLKTKLDGIAAGATANDTDANLKNRANHTGTQAISTVSGLQAALDSKQPTITPGPSITDAATNASTNLSTDYQVSSGLPDIVAGLNANGAANNVLGAKYNDLATKFNALLATLEDQGLLEE